MPKRARALATATMISSMPRVLRRKILEFGPSHRTRWNAVMQELVARRVCHARLDPDDESNPNVCPELIPVSYIRRQALRCETCESNCCDTCSKYKAYNKLGEHDWGEWLICNECGHECDCGCWHSTRDTRECRRCRRSFGTSDSACETAHYRLRVKCDHWSDRVMCEECETWYDEAEMATCFDFQCEGNEFDGVSDHYLNGPTCKDCHSRMYPGCRDRIE